jgi:hypothetical protein
MMDDPQGFLEDVRAVRMVLNEIYRDVNRAYTRAYEGVEIRFVSLRDLIADIVGKTV